MSIRGPRLEFAVGAFLLLALATLLVLALASTNGKFSVGGGTSPLKARFSSIGQLRASGPVKIGGVTIGNVAVQLHGRWLTPPLSAGLLPGVMRQSLLDAGQLHEAPIRLDELPHATALALINSVRGWVPVELARP